MMPKLLHCEIFRKLCLVVSVASLGVVTVVNPACGQTQDSRDAEGLLAQNPIRITGQRDIEIQGRHIAGSPSITLTDCHDVLIADCDLRDIQLNNCTNVRILNNTIHDSDSVGIGLDECENIFIQGNHLTNVASGVYAHRGRSIRVLSNRCDNVQGPMPRGQMVQFDKVAGAGNEVAYNFALNHMGNSQPEDVISLYQSHGTPDHPIDIHHNLILGDPAHGSQDKSDSGSGIMLGDGGGSFQLARHNLLISPGQVGIGVAGGKNIAVVGNLVRGEASDVSNVGIYAWNQTDQRGGAVTINSNAVHWTNADGQPNDIWYGDGFAKIAQRDNTPRATNLLRWRSLLNAWTRSFGPTSE